MNPDTLDGLRSLLPSLNASLNGASVVFLLAGYCAIRGGRVGLHRLCLLTALSVSALFLGSYLFYHFVIMAGQHTSFRERVPEAPEWVARFYLGILLSHTLLAVAVAPMALTSTYLGLRDRRVGHRRLARWTLPLWLYVSATGVVIYWMLYRMY